MKTAINSASRFEEIGLQIIEAPRTISGIYFLMEGALVVYVGQSRNIAFRIAEHHRDRRILFSKYAVFECAIEEMDNAETRFILKYKPMHNLSIPSKNTLFLSGGQIKARAGITGMQLKRTVRNLGYSGIEFNGKTYFSASQAIKIQSQIV